MSLLALKLVLEFFGREPCDFARLNSSLLCLRPRGQHFNCVLGIRQHAELRHIETRCV